MDFARLSTSQIGSLFCILRRGKTRREISEALNVGQSYIAQIESGEKLPSAAIVDRICTMSKFNPHVGRTILLKDKVKRYEQKTAKQLGIESAVVNRLAITSAQGGGKNAKQRKDGRKIFCGGSKRGRNSNGDGAHR
ncbi:MAG: helix-turn-helix transcriptional regulator [Deltaproteobacteria bacterium]|nr:helix-turn-helix transcriptional regulator [Deltaproteobacteria bacterium]